MKQNFKYYIPLLIASAIFMVMASSCVATKKQKQRFLSKYCERKDSISYVKKDSLVYKDSLILFPIEINTPVYLENPCKLLCDSLGNLKPFFKDQKKGGLKTTVQSIGNSIVINCQTDSLKARISWLEHNISTIEKSHTENRVEKPCELEHRTKWDGFTWYWFMITASILVLWILIKIFKGYFMIALI